MSNDNEKETKYRSLIPDGARKAIGAIDINALELKQDKTKMIKKLKESLDSGDVVINDKPYKSSDLVDSE